MQQGNMVINTSWGNNLNFFGYVCNDDIYTNSGELIGVNLKKYQEVEQALTTCKNRLIELGEIKLPKTQDEIIKEQSEMLEKQSETLKQIMTNFQQLQEQLNEHSINSRHSFNVAREHTEQCDTSNQQDVSDIRPVANQDASRCAKGDTSPKKSRATT